MLQLSSALVALAGPVLVGAGGWVGVGIPVAVVGVLVGVPVGVAVPTGLAVVGLLDGAVFGGLLDRLVLEPFSAIPAGSGSGPLLPPQAVKKAAHTRHRPENSFDWVESLIFMTLV
jgi:hypothetical protein